MVLDRVVGAPRKQLGNLGPLVAERGVCVENETVFLRRPRILLDSGVKMVVPPLAALLANASLRTREAKREYGLSEKK